jgi:hypothetical protein
VEDERAAAGAGLGALDLADEERVVARLLLSRAPAAKPAQRVVQLRRPLGVAQGNALPERDRRHPAGEVLCQGLLALGEHAHGELVRAAQQLVQRRVPPDRNPDERGIQGQRDERSDRQADALAGEIDRDDGDPGWEAAHDRTKLVAADHRAII